VREYRMFADAANPDPSWCDPGFKQSDDDQVVYAGRLNAEAHAKWLCAQAGE
jgi:hypothetical protein